MHKSLYFFALILATVGFMFGVRLFGVTFDLTQIASVTIFSMFIYGTLLLYARFWQRSYTPCDC